MIRLLKLFLLNSFLTCKLNFLKIEREIKNIYKDNLILLIIYKKEYFIFMYFKLNVLILYHKDILYLISDIKNLSSWL